MKSNVKKEYTFIEVCAGAGGLSKGFIDIGFKPLLLNLKTLKMNQKIFKIVV